MRIAARIAIAAAVAVAIPLVRLWTACRDPMSEACVWGKAYLPLSIGLYLVIAGPVVFLAVYLIDVKLVRRP
ncbi:MAG: hypothetical protein WA208_20545 [Thermoanaerobaculia bacterium]